MNGTSCFIENTYKAASSMIKEDLFHPMRFAGNLINDSLEFTEDLIDWKNGTLPKETVIFLKTLSLASRFAGLAIIGGLITFVATQWTTIEGTAMAIELVRHTIMWGISGSMLLLLGREIRKDTFEEKKIKSYKDIHTHENKDGAHTKGRGYYTEMKKVRIAWRSLVALILGRAHQISVQIVKKILEK